MELDKKTIKWNRHFLKIAAVCSEMSDDPDTRVGAVLAGAASREIRSTGYNGLPRGIVSTPERKERPEKYFWMEHAERNAIYNAARFGTPLEDCVLYTQWIPCADCSRAVIQAGIKRIVVDATQREKWATNEKWIESTRRSVEMLEAAGVQLVFQD